MASPNDRAPSSEVASPAMRRSTPSTDPLQLLCLPFHPLKRWIADQVVLPCSALALALIALPVVAALAQHQGGGITLEAEVARGGGFLLASVLLFATAGALRYLTDACRTLMRPRVADFCDTRAWISGVAGVLCTIFYVLTLLFTILITGKSKQLGDTYATSRAWLTVFLVGSNTLVVVVAIMWATLNMMASLTKARMSDVSDADAT